MSSAQFFYTTWPDAEAAMKAGRILVQEGLCACVNIMPGALSIYRWEGQIEANAEAVMIIKSRADRATALHQRIAALHPYDLPAFAAIALDDRASDAAYLGWITAQSAPPGEG